AHPAAVEQGVVAVGEAVGPPFGIFRLKSVPIGPFSGYSTAMKRANADSRVRIHLFFRTVSRRLFP
ncbi:MAG: hypothetical protein WCJ14_13530, partial [Verrucomicrobiota bacterium]